MRRGERGQAKRSVRGAREHRHRRAAALTGACRARSRGSRRTSPASGGTTRRAGRGRRRRATRLARSSRRRAGATACRRRAGPTSSSPWSDTSAQTTPKSLSLTVTRHESSSSALSQRLRGSSRRTPSLSSACPLGPAVRLSTTPKSVVLPLRHSSGWRCTITGSYSRAPAIAAVSSSSSTYFGRVAVGPRSVAGGQERPEQQRHAPLRAAVLMRPTSSLIGASRGKGSARPQAQAHLEGHEREERQRDLSARVDRRAPLADRRARRGRRRRAAGAGRARARRGPRRASRSGRRPSRW